MLPDEKTLPPCVVPRILRMGAVTVEVAPSAGFCFGVHRAVCLTEELLKQGRLVFTWGELIHNPQMVRRLAEQGARTAHKVSEVSHGATVVVRSHGVTRECFASLQALGPLEDGTCPFVAKIHRIAERCSQEGGTLLIAGDAAHPEVIGIAGRTNGPTACFQTEQELLAVLSGLNPESPLYMVAQTTFEEQKWLQFVALLKKVCTNAIVFDTICSATLTRQRDAEVLAHRSDVVIIIGGRSSSNTQKLEKVAGAYAVTHLIETADELKADWFDHVQRVGVTAGASTPSFVIEEVLSRMSEVILEGEKSFEEMLNDSMKPVYAGQVVKGIVEAVSANEVTVDIGMKQTGIIELSELTDDPSVRSAEEVVKKDDELELVVTKVNDQEGIIYLSRTQLEGRKGAEEVAKAAEDGTILEGYVKESNKGGLVAIVKGVKVFIPASQATARRGDDYLALVHKTVKLKIKEFTHRRVIGSVRDVLADAQNALRKGFWDEVEVGRHYVGTVKSLTSYGAFVDIGGVDGLVHISELSWSRVKHPSEVLQVGNSIEVYVKDIDREHQKVSLGFKKQQDNPWQKLREEYPVGSVFLAPVVNITQFGAFVRILPGIDGLVHISEISRDHIEKVSDALKIGQEVEVKLIDVDFDRNRISLSIKALMPEEQKSEEGTEQVVASASAEETVISPGFAKPEEQPAQVTAEDASAIPSVPAESSASEE